MMTTPEHITHLEPNEIFVFGSNLGGRHGAGAARTAMLRFDAQWGVGVGRTGQCYAIPTKDRQIRTLPLDVIGEHVNVFIGFAQGRPDLRFLVTPIGCGLAGYHPRDIAPMFRGAPENVVLPASFIEILNGPEPKGGERL